MGGDGGDGGDNNGNNANGGNNNSGDFSGNGGIAVGNNGNGGTGGDAIGGESPRTLSNQSPCPPRMAINTSTKSISSYRCRPAQRMLQYSHGYPFFLLHSLINVLLLSLPPSLSSNIITCQLKPHAICLHCCNAWRDVMWHAIIMTLQPLSHVCKAYALMQATTM